MFRMEELHRQLLPIKAKGIVNMGAAIKLETVDYLFMKYRSMAVDLMTIVSDYYPHLSKAEALRKANNCEFPSQCKIDKSKRAPFWCILMILLMF